ncbi:UrcA family protein [Novosphingobium piscinae]|uniref:UrcA family protein n=1 Tax=Novosphingobium piscinae TaxID=1507448 RepID=A0A7X1FZB1_9SPHN|nr:UrcA family protein [Novosphingobium piscinae]MBC2669745.1 UrcA family protein [Novosphingobium piscinae]
MKILPAALVAVALLAGSSAALAGGREKVSLPVVANGVDFANPESVAKFRSAAARQIAAACNPGDRIGADLSPDFKCRREMSASIEPKVRQLVMAATNNARMATN